MLNKRNILIIILSFSLSQDTYTGYVVEEQDTLDIFSYQIPSNYLNENDHPLLVAFHQWGGNQNTPYYTQFDEEAEERGWLFLSPFGGATNNYNHQGAQYMVEQEIIWMQNNFNINTNKIYII